MQEHAHRRFQHPRAELARRFGYGTDGMVTVTDWNRTLTELGTPVNKAEREMVFRSLDPLGHGSVTVGTVVWTVAPFPSMMIVKLANPLLWLLQVQLFDQPLEPQPLPV
jgi:hypothetical protein